MPFLRQRTSRALCLAYTYMGAGRAYIGLLGGLALACISAVTAWGDGHEEITVSHGYSNFGELKYGPGEAFSYVNPEAPKGGEISIASQGTFDSFNIYTRKGVPAANTGLLYEDLMISAADDPYGIYCYLCETIEYPESLDWITVNLRDDVTFSDGTPMTADDVKFTVDLFLDQGITEFRSVVEAYYESVEVLDTHRIRFTFTDAAPKRDRVGLVAIWNPFSRAWFEETGARLDDSTDEPFLGTGPYVLAEFDIARSLLYEKSPNWWGADHHLNIGRHNFDAIRVEYFADAIAAHEGFKAGEYTVRIESSSKSWATAYDFPALEKGWVKKETLPDGNISSAQGFIFNLRREKWQDPRTRDAVRMLFNFEWSNETLFYGLYQRPASFWGGSDLAADGTPSQEELAILEPLVGEGLLDESILTAEAVMPPVNDAGQNRPSRRVLRAASALLDEAGWITGDDGMRRNAEGETLDLVVIQFSPLFDRIVNPYVENLRSVGINAKLERVDNAQYVERRRSGDWDLTNHSPGQGFEPSTGLKQWFSSETAEDSSRNLMALRDPAIDSLIDTVIGAETLDTLRPSVQALDRVLRAQGFWVPQWANQDHWVAYWDMYGRPETLPPLALGTLDFWWHDAEGEARLRDAGAL
ncbi:MAG: extracellular solute-binding protein [Pseudomonadota bacterium]